MSDTPRPARTFLDTLFGAWFMPRYTFGYLKQSPIVWQAVLVVAFINVVDTGRQSGFSWESLDSLIASTVTGLAGWTFMAGLLALLGYAMGRNVSFPVVLTLTGFASLPWLLLAPAQAFGAPWGALFGLGVVGWFWVSELIAIATAFEQDWWRVVWLAPLAFAAALIATIWFFIGFIALVSLI